MRREGIKERKYAGDREKKELRKMCRRLEGKIVETE